MLLISNEEFSISNNNTVHFKILFSFNMPQTKAHTMELRKRVASTKHCLHEDKWDLNEVPNYICRINPDLYSIRVTRRISKILHSINNFTIIEVYKCMPLLGDEYNVPYWDVHAVKYSINFAV